MTAQQPGSSTSTTGNRSLWCSRRVGNREPRRFAKADQPGQGGRRQVLPPCNLPWLTTMGYTTALLADLQLCPCPERILRTNSGCLDVGLHARLVSAAWCTSRAMIGRGANMACWPGGAWRFYATRPGKARVTAAVRLETPSLP